MAKDEEYIERIRAEIAKIRSRLIRLETQIESMQQSDAEVHEDVPAEETDHLDHVPDETSDLVSLRKCTILHRVSKPATPTDSDVPAMDQAEAPGDPVEEKVEEEEATHHPILQPVETKAKQTTPLELLIGIRGMAIAGGIIIILAILALLKLGFDYGWWGKISPEVRCMFAGAVGLALLGVGEVAFRKINKFAAIGLFGAGLGTLYVTSYATTWRSIDVCSEGSAFLLLALVALIGLGITIRGQLLTIGILSMIGGYLAPLLVQPTSTFFTALPLYLSFLLLISLGLTTVRPASFGPMRYVAIGFHVALSSIWLLEIARSQVTGSLIFLAGWWVVIVAESVRSAMKERSSHGNIVMTVIVTTWFVITAYVLMSGTGGAGGASVAAWWADQTGLFTLAVGVICAVIVLQFGSGLDALRIKPRTAMDKLSICLWCQCGVLITTAVGLHFTDYGQTISWLVMAVLSVEAGRRLPSRGVDAFGLIVGALAAFRIVCVDWWASSMLSTTVYSSSWLTLTGWSFLTLGGIAAALVIAHRFRGATKIEFWKPIPTFVMVVSVAGWCVWLIIVTTAPAVVVAFLMTAIVLIALRRFGREQHYLELGITVHALAILYWLLVGIVDPRVNETSLFVRVMPFLNDRVGLTLLLVGAGVWSCRVLLLEEEKIVPTKSKSIVAQLAGVAALVIVLVVLSVEIDSVVRLRAGRSSIGDGRVAVAELHTILWITLLWVVGSGMLTAVGVLRRGWRVVGTIGWGMLVLCGVAYLLIDTLIPRIINRAPSLTTVIANPQFGVGILILVGLVLLRWWWIRRIQRNSQWRDAEGLSELDVVQTVLPIVAVIGLWLGLFEIDRFFAPDQARVANSEMARQTMWSAYGGLYSLGLIGWGILRRSRPARLAGLALLIVTLLKVLIVDMSEVEMIYRVLSLAVIGLLMVVTSIAYARFAPRLFGEDEEDGEVGEE